jgi:hypothetical protein
MPNNRNVISWANNYKVITQISIQRSTDSLRNFKTILTVPDPTVPQNGFVDIKAPSARIFYRLFIVLEYGHYVFSKSKVPAPDTGTVVNDPILKDNQRVVLSDSLTSREVSKIKEKLSAADAAVKKEEKFFVVKRNNVYSSVSENNFKRFRDSIVYQSRDTLVFEAVDTLMIRPFVPKEVYRASKYVFTEKYGNLMISLPDAVSKKYSINFFEENKSPIFEISEVKSASLIVDKTNFVHSGWFYFELYENGELKERNKFYIPKDF